MQRFKRFINSLLMLLDTKCKQVEDVVSNEVEKKQLDYKSQVSALEKKLELAKNAHLDSVVEINLYKAKKKHMEKSMQEWQKCVKKANERYLETNNGLYEAKAKEAFMMYKECVAKIEVLDKGIEVLDTVEAKLRIVKDNSASIIGKAKIEVMKIEGQEDVSRITRKLTEGLGDIINIKIEQTDSVSRECLKNEEMLKELLIHTECTSDTEFDKEYETFVKGWKQWL